MGLFDFVKDAGAKIFGKEDKSEQIHEMLEKEFGDHISELTVKVDEDIVYLSGVCDSAATKEKAILIAGNVEGIAQVNDDKFLAPQPQQKVTFYTVKSGDSLSKIAKHFYGNAMLYTKIFEANREVIKNPDLIYPGQKIRIPELETN